MEGSLRSRRHRNPQTQETPQAEQQPFFSKTTAGSTVQAKQETPFFQPKLTIGEPNDHFEKEADAVADKVVNQTAHANPSVQKQDISSVQKADKKEEEKPVQKADKKEEEKPVQKMDKKEEEKPVQKMDKKEEEKPVQKMDKKEEEKPVQKMDKKEEEKPVQKMDKKEEEKPVQKAPAKAAPASSKGGVAKESFESKLAHTKDKGKPLPEKIRAKMEAQMQHDFSSVRIHDDATAAALTEEIHAHAFTHGHDIYFNTGTFSPETPAGAHLLAHELTHVVQQGAAPTKATKKH